MGSETTLYTLLRRHHNVIREYERLRQEDDLASELPPVIDELIGTHREAHDRAEELLRDFPNLPVKPNEQSRGGTEGDAYYPTNFAEVSLVSRYLREVEMAVAKLYAKLAGRDDFPEPIYEFLKKYEQELLENVNRLDFKAKAR